MQTGNATLRSMPAGRPAIPFDAAIADAICDAISTQSKGLGQIIEDLGFDISPSLIYKWLQADSAFCERYARAKADQARVLADQISELADIEPRMCEIPTKSGATYEAVDRGHLEWRRQQVEARKWLAAKLLPKVYGERIAQELSGPGGAALQIVSTIPRPKQEE